MAALMALMLTAAAGCASRAVQTNAADGASRSGAFPTVTSWRDYIRPIDQYLPTADQAVSLQRLAYSTEASCLTQKGYTFNASDLEPVNLPDFIRLTVRDQVVRSDIYGFFDTDNVAKYGYTRPPGAPGAVTLRLPDGVPADVASACRSGGQALVGPAASGVLPNGGPVVAKGDPRIVAATKSWVQCMSDAGVSVSDPIQAESDHQTTSASDISIANADINCKARTNLVGIALGVQTEEDNKYIVQNQAALNSYTTSLQALLVRAASA